MSGTEDLRAARESRADVARRAGRAGLGDAMTRMVDAAVYRATRKPVSRHEAGPRQPEWGVLHTPDGIVRYLDSGRGSPVLLVHGTFEDPSSALDRHGAVVPAGTRVIAPARFGYTGSSLPADATPASQADVFAALLDELGIATAAVVAISSGTNAALQLAVRHPERVAALALIEPNGPGCHHGDRRAVPRWLAAAVWRSDLLTRLGRHRLVTGLERRTGRWVVLPPAGVDEQHLDGALFDVFVSDPDVNNGYDLAGITAPTLVACARNDTLVPLWGAAALAQTVPGAHLLTVDCGADRPLGAHTEVATAVRALLQRTAH
jgi:pimeloyl-ACP methyl ester carboxylesterase